VSSDDETQSSATESNPFAQLAPAPQHLRDVAAGTLRRARSSFGDLERELAASPEGEEMARIRDLVPSPANGEDSDLVTKQLDELWARVSGRNAYEQLLSLFIVNGIVRDALVGFGELGEPPVGLGDELDWAPWHDAIVETLKALFERDIHVDDRLAMWGRRIAGDAVVWARQLAGIEPGKSADALVEGAEAGAEKFAGVLLANHSRRMNALKLAA
jgi:hypothetical protein